MSNLGLGNSFSGTIALNDGASATPSVAFVSETTLGFYRIGAASLGLHGALTVSALLTGSLGLTVTGAAVSLNATGAFAVTIGSAAAGAVALASGTASSFQVTAANLTLGTLSSGTTAVVSAGLLTLTGVGASVWTPGVGATIVSDTGTGIKIGTGTTQKLGFFNAAPVAQQLKANHNNWAATSDVVSALVNLGFFDQV